MKKTFYFIGMAFSAAFTTMVVIGSALGWMAYFQLSDVYTKLNWLNKMLHVLAGGN